MYSIRKKKKAVNNKPDAFGLSSLTGGFATN